MAMPLSPCKGCTERSKICHAICKAYKEFEAAREALRQSIYREKSADLLARSTFIDKRVKEKQRLRKLKSR